MFHEVKLFGCDRAIWFHDLNLATADKRVIRIRDDTICGSDPALDFDAL
ncbi:MAG: hypothetical protein JWM99_1797, partial [Verrucomicrobiales bacterium]|nr:hypothetical protein [Verrucomicrobiales bacterium]